MGCEFELEGIVALDVVEIHWDMDCCLDSWIVQVSCESTVGSVQRISTVVVDIIRIEAATREVCEVGICGFKGSTVAVTAIC